MNLIKKENIVLVAFIFIIIINKSIKAQNTISDSKLWTHFSTSNGLPQNNIRHVLEDIDGSLLVVTTNSGIFRYDGLQFLPLSINDQLPSVFIQRVVKDKRNRLWIACNYAGMWIYDRGELYPFEFNDMFKNEHFSTHYCDKDGNIWIDVNQVGLFFYDGNKCINLTEAFNLPEDDILQIEQISKDEYYFLHVTSGLLKFSFFSQNHISPAIPNHKMVHNFFLNKNDDLWIFKRLEGIVKYSDMVETTILQINELTDYLFDYFLQDSQKRIWFSKKNGFYCFENGKLSFFTKKMETYGRPFEDRFKNIWFATSGGLYKFMNPELKSWQLPPPKINYSVDQGIKKSNQFLYQTREGKIWFTDKYFQLYYFYNGKVNKFEFPDSLGSVRFTDIAQDDKNKIWLGTEKHGVYCWDGINFAQPIPKDSLAGEFISSIYIDSKKRVWISSISCLPFFDYHKTRYNEIRLSDLSSPSLDNSKVTSLLVDNENRVWLGTRNDFILRSTTGNYEKINTTGFPVNKYINIQNLYYNKFKLWGTANWGIFKLNLQKNLFSFFRKPSLVPEILKSPFAHNLKWVTGDFFHCNSIYLLEDFKDYKKDPTKPIYNISSYHYETWGDLWVGSYSVGLFLINKENIIRFSSERGLPSFKISALFRDSKRNFWIGTLDHGLFLLKDSVVVQYDWMKDVGKSVSTFFEDSKRQLWIGTFDNGLVTVKNNQVVYFNKKKAGPAIWGISETPSGDIVTFLNDGNFGKLKNQKFEILDQKTFLADDEVKLAFKNKTINCRSVFLEPSQKISSGLVCLDGNKINRFTVDQGLPGHEITDIVETSDGKIWVSTLNTGVAVLENDIFKPIIKNDLKRLTRMTKLCAAKDSALWIFTDGEGLAWLKNDSIRVWGSESKVITVAAQNIQLNKKDKLLFNTSDNEFYFFNEGDLQPFADLSIDENVMPFFLADSLNQLWFTTDKRNLYRYKMKNIPPIVKIKNCQLGNDLFDEIQIKKPLYRDYKNTTCVIEFFGYHSSFPTQNLKFSHRVIKNRKADEWSKPTSRNRLIYSELEPGKNHIFQFRAQTPNGIYSSDFASVEIQLEKIPVYFQVWFIWVLLSLTALLIALYFIYRFYRIKKIIMRRRFNPFIAGEPIFDRELFFGRQKVLNHVLSIIHNNSIMITGERRIGKTSLLIQIKNELLKTRDSNYTFIPIFIDLQGVSQWDFFTTLISDIVEQTKNSSNSLKLRVHKNKKNYNYRDFNSDFRKIITHISSRYKNSVKLILLIDEADAMNLYDQAVHAQLRRIFMQDFSLNFGAVIAGTDYIQNWNRPESPWWNLFTLVQLKPINKADAKKLIQEPVKGIFKFKDETLEKIIDHTNCKPFLIQQLCIKLVNHALDERRRTIYLEDVNFFLD